jgi:hypothetical protein
MKLRKLKRILPIQIFFHYSNEKSTDKSLNWQFIDDPNVITGMKNSWVKWDKSIKQPDM